MHRRSFLRLAVLAGTSTVWPTRFVSEDFVAQQLREVDQKGLQLRTVTKGRAELWKYKWLAFIENGPIAYTPGIEDIELTEISEGYFEQVVFKFEPIEALSTFTINALGLMDEHGRLVGKKLPQGYYSICMCRGDLLRITYTLCV